MTTDSPGPATLLFSRWRAGDEAAAAELLPQIYSELRRLAAGYLRRERRDHTLQPTELVNEAFVRLLGGQVEVVDRSHFFALAARTMRRILVDHARRLRTNKKLDAAQRVTLLTELTPGESVGIEILELHEALEQLQRVAPRSARLVELRYFGGLTTAEAGQVLEISVATAERDWKTARVWLRQELGS